MKGRTIELTYKPRLHQEWIYLKSKDSKFICVIMHRRGGKTVGGTGKITIDALSNPKRNPHYAYISPTYKQSKLIAWEMMKEHLRNVPNVKFHESDLSIKIARPAPYDDVVSIWLLGSENPDSIRGVYLDGCIFDEYGDCDPDIYGSVLVPALADRDGWIMFIGTPKGRNHFFEMYHKFKAKQESGDERYFTALLKASDTKIFTKEQLLGFRENQTSAQFNQEFECSFIGSVEGAYYASYIKRMRDQDRITKVDYQPQALVDTFWDLGKNDSTAIWFRQKINREWHYIDYYENKNEFIPFYAEVLKRKGYNYGRHVLPHDGEVKDIGGTGVSRRETLERLSPGVKVECQKRQSKEDGIEASRQMLSVCYMDKNKCHLGIDALSHYHREYDKMKRVYKNEAVHDWSSDGADAFKYASLDIYQSGESSNSLQTRARRDYDIFGYGMKGEVYSPRSKRVATRYEHGGFRVEG